MEEAATKDRGRPTAADWAKLPPDLVAGDVVARPARSFWRDVWFRFRQRKSAMGGAIVLLVIAALAVLGPSLTGHTYSSQENSLANVPPWFQATVLPGVEGRFYINPHMKLIEVTDQGELVRQVPQVRDDLVAQRMEFDLDGRTLTVDYTAQPPALLDQAGARVLPSVHTWNKSHVFGTDMLGRDVLTRVLYGCRISLAVAFIAALVNMVIGIVYGGVSGYVGGMVDNVMMRLVDIISTIPLPLYVILIKVVLGSGGFVSIVIALSSVYWVDMARVVRGQALSLKSQEFVLAARTIGTPPGTILRRHIVPNAMGPILVTATMLIPAAIFVEAFLSFIGIGIAPPMASLGTMCNDALMALRSSPYQLLLPAAAICVIMFAFNFVGDGLRDALDPKLRK
ncbi:MAG: ABC transporter permease [Propionibacteriaceae bacterium]|jgi:oligopeptide transport system permease protein|nr:ABC transporter permease [Propionibacteriaceae bacterium]